MRCVYFQYMHFMELKFGVKKNNVPEIYGFLFSYLPKALHILSLKSVKVEIDRLEPLDKIYTNLPFDERYVIKAFNRFAVSHHLRQVKDPVLNKTKVSLRAEVPATELGSLFFDYNLLFDIFFTEVILKASNAKKALQVSLLDPFSNSCLVESSDLSLLENFVELVKKQSTRKIFAKLVDQKKKGLLGKKAVQTRKKMHHALHGHFGKKNKSTKKIKASHKKNRRK